jgi:hypothetical protein
VQFFVVLVGLGLLASVVSMARGDTGPGTYVLFLSTGLVAFIVGLWFLAGWLNPS